MSSPIVAPLLSRRELLLAAASVPLAACSQTPTLELVRDTMAVTLGTGDGYPRTRQQVEDTPYAQLGVRIGRGSRGIMVLSQQQGDELQWLSANRIMLSVIHSRIVKTVGLPTDLTGSQSFGPDLLQQYDHTRPDRPLERLRRSVDAGTRFGISVTSDFTIEGTETITILDQTVETMRVREDFQSSDRQWRQTNRYWLSLRSALAWRSVQHVTPGQPPIELEVLKRPA